MRLVRWFLVLGCLMVSIQVQAEEIQLELNGQVYKIIRTRAEKKLYDHFDGTSMLTVFQTKELITMPDGTVCERDATSKGITLGVMEVRGDVYFYCASGIFRFENGRSREVIGCTVSGEGMSSELEITPIKFESNLDFSTHPPTFCLVLYKSSICWLLICTPDKRWVYVSFPDVKYPKPTKVLYRSIGKESFLISFRWTGSPDDLLFFLNTQEGNIRLLTWAEEIFYNPSPILGYTFLVVVGAFLIVILRRRKKPVVAAETS